jgi:hypothetical protein
MFSVENADKNMLKTKRSIKNTGILISFEEKNL